jgi:hypothetical protein
MKYGELNLGQVEAIVNKLGGLDGVRRFLADELVVKPIQPELKIFKTLKLGTVKTADDFREAVKDKGMCIGDYANDILGKPAFTAAAEETEVDLVVISVAELGFKGGAKREDIYSRAKELGLQLCPSEAGPQLRIQYADQPKDEWLVIATEPITDSDGALRLFDVRHDDGDMWLSSYDDSPDPFWCGRSRFVFVLPRKQ